MESVNAITLNEFLINKKKNLKQSDVIKIVSSLLLAINSIHNAGFVHYDLHGDNILITPDLNITLIDFGCSDDISSVDPSDSFIPTIYMYLLHIKCHIASLIFPNLSPQSISNTVKLIGTYTEKDVIGYDLNPKIASSLLHILDNFAAIS